MESIGKRNLDKHILCPVCGHKAPRKVIGEHWSASIRVLDKIRESRPDWKESDGVCVQCYDFHNKI